MEDHFGDMDFKVAGTADGINAIQLDIKVDNIGFDVIEAALDQAKEARLTILDRMNEAIAASRSDLSQYAPRLTRIKIPIDKIGAVIGPGGKTIRGIVEETGATVDVEDDGTVTIGSTDGAAARKAVEIIESLTREAKVGDIFTGKVVRILNFGAFVEIMPGTDGMVHISELANYHVPTVEDVVSLGEEITVEVIAVDRDTGKIALSRRALLEGDSDSSQPREPAGARPSPARERDRPSGGGHRQGNGMHRGEGRQSGFRPRQGQQGGGRGEPGGGRPRQGPRPPGPRPPHR
jgi:polyribonucleotide nucleotidyltransferase